LPENSPEKAARQAPEDKPEKKPEKRKSAPGPRFLVSSSPHVHDGRTVSGIMRLVMIALLPAALFSIYIFGLSALRVMLISMASAALFEALAQRIMRRRVTLHDGSAVLTGLFLAMNLPATAPWWLIVVGNFFAIVIAKQLYGGLGYNPFNPALVGRVVLQISFPVQMTARWITPSAFGADAVTTATPLTRVKESIATLGRIDMDFGQEELLDYFVGYQGGCLGETSAALLLLGGLFLVWRRVITWHVPVAFIAVVWLMSGAFHAADPSRFADPTFQIVTGGLFIGAIFMATDYVTSPVTRKGMMIFGAGCGVITVLIRLFGAYPEGVSFSILLMNAAVPLIDRYTKPKVFGSLDRKKAAA